MVSLKKCLITSKGWGPPNGAFLLKLQFLADTKGLFDVRTIFPYQHLLTWAVPRQCLLIYYTQEKVFIRKTDPSQPKRYHFQHNTKGCKGASAGIMSPMSHPSLYGVFYLKNLIMSEQLHLADEGEEPQANDMPHTEASFLFSTNTSSTVNFSKSFRQSCDWMWWHTGNLNTQEAERRLLYVWGLFRIYSKSCLPHPQKKVK